MDCAASITPPSTSFMEDSTIRAIKGAEPITRGTMVAVEPSEVPTIARVTERSCQQDQHETDPQSCSPEQQNEERRAAQEVNYNAKRAVEHRHGPDAVFPTHHQQHAERQPDEISKQRGHDHHIKCFQRSLQKQVQHLLREHHPSPPRNARFVR